MIALKKHILAPILFVLLSVASHGQVTNSVLADGNWYKFAVDTTGVFKIDRAFLQQLGISTNNLNPKKIQIYGNGGQLLPELNADFRYDDLQENAIFIEGEEDNSFDANDYILFYAKGPHSWEVNPAQGTVNHIQNIYSDKSYYFMTINEDDGKRIQSSSPVVGSATTQITTFNDYVFYEKETTNLFAVGKKWLGEDFTVDNELSLEIPFQNIVITEPVNIKVRAVAVSELTSSMQVKVNSQDLFNLNFSTSVSSGSGNRASDRSQSTNLSISTPTIDFNLNYNNGGNPSARAYLDYIEVSGKKQLIVDDFQFSFRSFEATNTTGVVEYQVQNSQNISQIWNVTDPINATNIINESTS